MSAWRWLTPPGLGAVAVVCLEGPLPDDLLAAPGGGPLSWPGPGRVRLARLVEAGAVLDEAVVVGREDGAELHLHGGRGVARALVAALARRGWHEQRRAVRAAPRSLREARARFSAEDGPLAALARQARQALDVGELTPALRIRLERSLARAPLARRLRTPAVVRLVGRPNAGKSTLFNALLAHERALVSPRPGTTRDTVSALLRVRGVPVLLEDTAGGERSDPGPGAGADALVHLLTDPGERPLEGALAVLGKADRRAPGAGDVSGLTGEGVEALLERLAEALALSGDPRDDALAPWDVEQEALLRRAFELPVAGPSRGADEQERQGRSSP